MQSDYQEPAKFNMGLDTLQRISECIRESRRLMLQNPINYQQVLKIEEELWMEVRPYMRKGKMLEKRKEIDKLIEEANKNVNYQQPFNRRALVNKEKKYDFITSLKKLRLLIRDTLDILGYLMPKTDDPRYAAYN